DFDAMVSQIAPLDALRQRFGRLARRGNRGDAPAPGIMLAARAETGTKASDPIYGRAPAGRTFREWVLVSDRDETLWVGLIDEARVFVAKEP
ncbi:MAG: hypothetical protein H5T76_24150, partial [Streptomyces sp.]|nr:hypothetical protein [Streptomyces sp.]